MPLPDTPCDLYGEQSDEDRFLSFPSCDLCSLFITISGIFLAAHNLWEVLGLNG